MKQNRKLTVRLGWLFTFVVFLAMSMQYTTYATTSKKVSLTYQKPATITVGTSKMLRVRSNGKVTYKTSNKSIATVTKGKLTAKKIGNVKITIKAKKSGYKTTTKSFTVKVVPKRDSIKSITTSGSAIRVKAKTQKGITGYQFKYATNSKFKNAIKKNSKSNILTINTKVGNAYYITVRTYKKIGKTYYYGAWSPVATHVVNQDYTDAYPDDIDDADEDDYDSDCDHIWTDEQMLVKDEYYEKVEIWKCHCGKEFTNDIDYVKHSEEAEEAYNEAVDNGTRDEYWDSPYGNCGGGSWFTREIYHPAEYKTVTKCKLCGATK